jgi:hypothetical protein
MELAVLVADFRLGQRSAIADGIVGDEGDQERENEGGSEHGGNGWRAVWCKVKPAKAG